MVVRYGATTKLQQFRHTTFNLDRNETTLTLFVTSKGNRVIGNEVFSKIEAVETGSQKIRQ